MCKRLRLMSPAVTYIFDIYHPLLAAFQTLTGLKKRKLLHQKLWLSTRYFISTVQYTERSSNTEWNEWFQWNRISAVIYSCIGDGAALPDIFLWSPPEVISPLSQSWGWQRPAGSDASTHNQKTMQLFLILPFQCKFSGWSVCKASQSFYIWVFCLLFEEILSGFVSVFWISLFGTVNVKLGRGGYLFTLADNFRQIFKKNNLQEKCIAVLGQWNIISHFLRQLYMKLFWISAYGYFCVYSLRHCEIHFKLKCSCFKAKLSLWITPKF